MGILRVMLTDYNRTVRPIVVLNRYSAQESIRGGKTWVVADGAVIGGGKR